MAKLFFIVIIATITSNVYTQPNDNLRKYYFYVNKAELASIKNEFAGSALFFDSAFIHNKHSFAIDKYHAGFVNLYCKNFDKSDSFFLDVIRLGLSPSHFTNSRIKELKDYLSTNRGKRFISNAFKVKLYSFIDTTLRHQLYKMKQDDQRFRLLEDGYTKYKDSIIASDAKNGDLLKEIIEKYNGLPGGYVTGIDTSNAFFPISYILLFHHSEGTFSQKFDFSDDIFRAVQTGSIRSSTGAALLERANSKYIAGGDLFALCIYDSVGTHLDSKMDFATLQKKNIEYCFGYHFPNSNITMDSINAFRELLLLEPFEDFKTKVYFEFEKGDTVAFFLNRLNLFVLPWSKKSDFDYACKQLLK